jgi:hypothetical protein
LGAVWESAVDGSEFLGAVWESTVAGSQFLGAVWGFTVAGSQFLGAVWESTVAGSWFLGAVWGFTLAGKRVFGCGIECASHGLQVSYLEQSARLAYLSWKIEIQRDWYRSQNGRDLGAKVKLCTPVHGLYV